MTHQEQGGGDYICCTAVLENGWERLCPFDVISIRRTVIDVVTLKTHGTVVRQTRKQRGIVDKQHNDDIM